MTVHLLDLPSDTMMMICGLNADEATDEDRLGTEGNIRAVDCVECLQGLIIKTRLETRLASKGPATPEDQWLDGGDTGLSSVTIWHVMTGRPFPSDWSFPSTPHDPDDLGRCLALLDTFPSWRDRLAEVAETYPRWAPLVANWDELATLFAEESPTGRAPRCYDRMQELLDEAGRD